MNAERTDRPRPGLERLESREMLSTLTVESEPNDRPFQADVVTFDTADGAAEIAGSISDRRDRDYFSFTAAEDGTVNLSFSSDDGLIGKVKVQNAGGVELLETEPNDGVNSGSFSVNAGDQILIRVQRLGKSTGDYNVSLSLNGPGDSEEPSNSLSETEPNDKKGSADPFSLGTDGSIQLQGTAASHRDKDYFVFTPTASGTLNVAVQAPDGTFAKLQVETNGEVEVFETEPNNGVNSGSFAVTAGTTYFIRLRSHVDQPAAYLVDLALVV